VTPVCEIDSTNLDIVGAKCPIRWIYRLEPIAAAVAIVLTLPIAAVIGLVITLLSGRSPLIRHARVGWRGSPLLMLKFRTMWEKEHAAPRLSLIETVTDAIPIDKSCNDPRIVSKFAAVCRRYSLDELPQLYHVARGQMSFVGPRPVTQNELDTYYGTHIAEVLQLKPGLTGLWQVLGRNRLTYSRRVKLDVMLARRASPILYFQILLRTLPRVASGYDAF
jgi:exopolysaccharide production protein ExoY